MSLLMPNARQRFFDQNGKPLVGGKLYSYKAGTSTPKATYSNYQLTTANTNPIILDANGECLVWIEIDYAYKFELRDASDILQWTSDNVGQLPDASTVFGDVHNFYIPNNQTSALDITSFFIDSFLYTSISYEVEIMRKSNTTELRQSGTLKFIYNATTNAFSCIPDLKGDDTGVEFQIVNSSGTVFKVQLTSTDIGTTNYQGNLKFQSRGGM